MGDLLSLSSPKAKGYGFVHANRYSKPGLVGGRGYPDSAAAWEQGWGLGGDPALEGPIAGKWFSGRCNHSALGPRAPKELFLGMRLVPQERIYFHHRLRCQLTQHLENGQWRGQFLLGH